MMNRKGFMQAVVTSLFLISGFFSTGLSAQQTDATPSLVVVEWLEPIIDAHRSESDVRFFKREQLPTRPLRVIAQQGNRIQVLLRKLGGLFWIPRHAVRLNHETALVLTCQDQVQSRNDDYRSFGMRSSDKQEKVTLTCINK